MTKPSFKVLSNEMNASLRTYKTVRVQEKLKPHNVEHYKSCRFTLNIAKLAQAKKCKN